eukprot:6714625-Prymnesium_polylepis.1
MIARARCRSDPSERARGRLAPPRPTHATRTGTGGTRRVMIRLPRLTQHAGDLCTLTLAHFAHPTRITRPRYDSITT